jgi:hypothetical protein
LRAASTTVPPRSASAVATARPMPLDAPVTTLTVSATHWDMISFPFGSAPTTHDGGKGLRYRHPPVSSVQ